MFTRRRMITTLLLLITVGVLWSITTTTPPKKQKPKPAPSNLTSSTHILNGKVVHLAIAETDCQLDPRTYPADKMMSEALARSLNNNEKAILQFANCKELKNWRRGAQKYLERSGNYQTSRRLRNVSVEGQEAITLKQICNNYKKQGAEDLIHDQANIHKRLKEGFKGLKANGLTLLGVVHQSPSLCTIASYQTIKREDNTGTNQIILLGISILNSRLIFTYLLSPHDDKDSFKTLNQKLIELNAANQNRNITGAP